jgi:hypothetical protein
MDKLDPKAIEIYLLKNLISIDNNRLVDACVRSGVDYIGCDTPEHLADKIIDLQEELQAERHKNELHLNVIKSTIVRLTTATNTNALVADLRQYVKDLEG